LQVKLSFIGRGKVITIEAWADPEVSRRLRLSDFKRGGT
jgi:hypothetical protein